MKFLTFDCMRLVVTLSATTIPFSSNASEPSQAKQAVFTTDSTEQALSKWATGAQIEYLTQPDLNNQQIRIELHPWGNVAPISATFDLSTGELNQAQITLLQQWSYAYLKYSRDLSINIEHEITAFRFMKDIYPIEMLGGPVSGTSPFRLVVTVGGSVGYRKLKEILNNTGNDGFFIDPAIGWNAEVEIVSGLLFSAYGNAAYGIHTGKVQNQASAVAGAQLSIALNDSEQLRLVLGAQTAYSGYRNAAGLDPVQNQLRLGIEYRDAQALWDFVFRNRTH